MFKRISLTYSTNAQRRFQGSRSLQTSWGMQAAHRFMADMELLPHLQWPDESALSSKHGLLMTHCFEQELSKGYGLRGVLEAADRLTWQVFMAKTVPGQEMEADIIVRMECWSAKKKRRIASMGVTFDWLYGNITSVHAISLGFSHGASRCMYCGATIVETILDEKSWPPSEAHLQHCPHDQAEYLPSRTDWDAGYNDGIKLIHHETVKSPAYQLGHDMGGLAYQALLSSGRTVPL